MWSPSMHQGRCCWPAKAACSSPQQGLQALGSHLVLCGVDALQRAHNAGEFDLMTAQRLPEGAHAQQGFLVALDHALVCCCKLGVGNLQAISRRSSGQQDLCSLLALKLGWQTP